MAPTLQALLLADQIYQEESSGKYVLAGTFHRLTPASFPSTFPRTVGAFMCLTGVEGDVEARLEFVEAQTGDVLVESGPLRLHAPAADLPVALAVEVPPLPLPRPGRYLLRLSAGGEVIGEAPVLAAEPAA